MNIYFHLVQTIQASGKYSVKQWADLLKNMKSSSQHDAALAKTHAERGDNKFVYALSTSANAASEYETSFDFLTAANEYERRHFRPWKDSDFKRDIENKKEFYTPEFFEILKTASPPSESSADESNAVKLVFFIGMPHSGSELLEQILNNHTQIFGMNAKPTYHESVKYQIDFRYRNGMIAFHVPEITQETVKQLRDTSSSGGLDDSLMLTPPAATVKKAKAAIERFSSLIVGNTAAISKYALRANGEADKAAGNNLKYVIDTDLENFLNVGLIRALYPDAIFINVQRDPLDTLLNCYQQRGFYANGYGAQRCFGYNSQSQQWSLDLGDLATYYVGYLDIMSHWRSTLPEGTIVDVSYEQLLQPKKLKPTLEKILNALGLELEEGIMSPSVPRYLDTTGAWKKYSTQLKPLTERLRQPLADLLSSSALPLTMDINYKL